MVIAYVHVSYIIAYLYQHFTKTQYLIDE